MTGMNNKAGSTQAPTVAPTRGSPRAVAEAADAAHVADVALVADTRERESLQGDSGILGPYPKPFESAKHAVVLPTNS